jgi:flavorubredoxin/NADPH-dependent 2,4-dienoyl-CoA reductase/sulfur reductase-like enzyme
MNKLELKKGITWVGALHPDLRVFDIIMETEFGTTYNSYLVKGENKVALFETVKVKFLDQYLDKIRSMVAIEDIDYIVVDHTEPDHVGSVEKMLELNPNITIVGSASAIGFLKEITNREFEAIKVNTGDTIDLGGKTLEFISAPFLHWPDSMYTYIREDKMLITCDSFGAHYSFDDILLSKVKDRTDYYKALKYYYTMIMGPFKNYVLSAIKKMENLDIDMICPGHGPVLDVNPFEIVDIYREWSKDETIFDNTTVVIPYVSAYGYTKELAEQIAEGVKSVGNIDVLMHDMVDASKVEVMEHIKWADGILFGTPTINGDALAPIWELVMAMSPITHKGKLTGVFGSYGWSGEGVPNIENRLKMVRTKQFAPGYKIRFKPNDEQLEHAYKYGLEFAHELVGEALDNAFINESHKTKTASAGDGTVKKWICVVCGDVFEGERPPEICPTCGASHEQFEEHVAEIIDFESQEALTILIVGNGLAGLSAAKEARIRNKKAVIKMITEEDHITYNRPMLIDYVLDDYDADHFIIEQTMWYEEENIDVLYDTSVTKVDNINKTLQTSKGELTYDKLILANGSHCFVPPITDIKSEGVYVLKDIKDAHTIMDAMKDVKDVAIIGGGLLGLEAADTFNILGKNVTVFEVSNALVPMQLDETAGCYLKSIIEAKGVKVITEACISHIAASDKAEGVVLQNGDIYDAQLILVSTGIRSNMGLIKEAAETNRGVVVNDKMETSLPDIYAAGDVAEYDGMIAGLYQTAIEQGKVAGSNAVGDDRTFSYTLAAAQFSNFEIDFFSVGETVEDENMSSVIVNDLEHGKYSRLFFRKDILVGGLLFGDMSKSIKIINGIKREALRADFTREFFG